MYTASAKKAPKAPMVRKQVYLESRQDRRLKQLAKKTGTAEAEIIRKALDEHLEEAEESARRLAAWKEAKAFIEELEKNPPAPAPRTWRREDLYDRPKRYFTSRH